MYGFCCRNQLQAVGGCQNNCVRFFISQLLQHGPSRFPIHFFKGTAHIHITIGSVAASLQAVDYLLPVISLNNLNHSINIFAAFLNFIDRHKILLYFGLAGFIRQHLLHTGRSVSVLLLLAASSNESAQAECQKTDHQFRY